MRRLFKWAGIGAGVVVLTVVLFSIGMRFHDGPIAIISGGPFTSGEPATTPASWSFLADRATVEFQTLRPPTSRTVWCAVHDGRLFVLSAYMATNYGKLWKQWPHYVEDDDRVIFRIDGKLYEQRLKRIREGVPVQPVMETFGRKYGFEGSADMVTQGDTWLFEVRPR